MERADPIVAAKQRLSCYHLVVNKPDLSCYCHLKSWGFPWVKPIACN